jgi:hypothetical protein
MLMGHYSVSLGLKAWKPGLSLGWLLFAVQFLDVLWVIFVLSGLEKIEMDASLGVMPVDFVRLTFTHSVWAVLLWSVVLAGVFLVLRRGGPRTGEKSHLVVAAVLAAACFSHWLLDIPVHRHDLPLLTEAGGHLGLGLWNRPLASFGLEMLLFLGGIVLYARSTVATDVGGRVGLALFALVGAGLTVAIYFGGGTPPATLFVSLALLIYLATTAAGAWLDRRRGPRRRA